MARYDAGKESGQPSHHAAAGACRFGAAAAGRRQGCRAFERLAKSLEAARGENGNVSLLRGDYRPDTAREEAVYQWQMDTGLHHSDAMREVAARPESVETASRLREMGYDGKDADRNELANEMMAKARRRFQEEHGSEIHVTRDLADNPKLQEQAKKKVN